ncbi:MAG: hypothetical protein DRJ32_00750 [Thermoprotei archaeon]|nr:MAG: hypothetical protein DRJ32_00750 [Thermoprotei archaeon]HDD63983.1 hypothetical protein [Thermoprotei archaeon]
MSELKYFAWQGIELMIPKDWDLAVDAGNFDNGYFRLDDYVKPRLEIKWEKIKFEKAPTSDKLLENFIKSMEKNLKKRKIQTKVSILEKQNTKVAEHDAVLAYVRSVQDALIVAWYCEKSERAFIAQTVFPAKEYDNQKKAFNTVIQKLMCHTSDENITWSAYGFKVKIPALYRLSNRKFTSGLSYLFFMDPKGYNIVSFGYSSMANVILKEYYSDIEEWFNELIYKKNLKKIGKFKRKKEENAQLNRQKHEARVLYLETYGFISKFKNYMVVYLWNCENLNRLYFLLTIIKGNRTKAKDLATSIMKDFQCH